ncbi:IS5 family transposase, partial [Streptomyces sp. WAC 01325]
MLIKVVKRSSDVSWRSDGCAVGAAGAAVAPDTEDGPAAEGSAAGLRRDLVACADRLSVAGRARAVRAVGDHIHRFPAVADRRDLVPYLEEVAGQSGCRRDHRVGGLSGFHRLPGPPACRRSAQKGADDPGRTRPRGLAAEPDDHGLGRSRGGLTTKIHLAVDASFHVLAVVITAGQRGDAPVFEQVMDRIRVPRTGGGHPRTRPERVLADRAYSSRQIRTYLRRRGIAHTIPEKRDQARHRLRRGSSGGRPPGFDREMYKRRHKVECRIGLLKQARGVAT